MGRKYKKGLTFSSKYYMIIKLICGYSFRTVKRI